MPSVPGLPREPAPDDSLAARLKRHAQETERLQAEWEARRKADEEAQNAPQTTAGILMGEIAKAATKSNSSHIPLNGAQVLRAALAGGHGTANGGER